MTSSISGEARPKPGGAPIHAASAQSLRVQDDNGMQLRQLFGGQLTARKLPFTGDCNWP